MNFFLTEEQEAVRDAVRDLADREFAPRAAHYDRTHAFPRENIDTLAELGYLCMHIPEAYGGGGSDFISVILVLEELARACAATAVVYEVHSVLVAETLHRWGSEVQRRHYLPRMAKAELLAAFALTEPTAGSDAAGVKTRAVRDGEFFVLDGQKAFITNGGVADFYLVIASTNPVARGKGLSAFIVDKGTPGLSWGKPEDKIGLHGSQTTQVFLEGVRVPAASRLGAEGDGLKIALSALDGGRIGIAAQAVGMTQAALDESLRYARERQQFGRPIAEFQAVAFKLADIAAQLEAARLLTYKAAFLHQQQRCVSAEAAMAKLVASDLVMKAATEAVQVHGGYGYMNEYKVARIFRDAKITQIYEGTSEIQKLVISRHLLAD